MVRSIPSDRSHAATVATGTFTRDAMRAFGTATAAAIIAQSSFRRSVRNPRCMMRASVEQNQEHAPVVDPFDWARPHTTHGLAGRRIASSWVMPPNSRRRSA